MSAGRIVSSRLLLVVASVLSVLALLAGWVRGQVLNQERYVDTATAVLAEPAVRAATADYLAGSWSRCRRSRHSSRRGC